MRYYSLTILLVSLGCITVTVAAKEFSPGKTTYYVDQRDGNDKNTGKSFTSPWKTLARVNNTHFRAGDQVLFAGGQTFKGRLNLVGLKGRLGKERIVFSSNGYKNATINAGKGEGLFVDNCENIHIEKLSFIGDGVRNGSKSNGGIIRLSEGIQVGDSKFAGFMWSGLHISSGKNIRLNQLHCHNNGYAGISSGPSTLERTVSELYIGRCTAENNSGCPEMKTGQSGSGIIIGGTAGGLIEHCEAKNNGAEMPNNGSGPIGIWAWNSDRVVIQHCISHDNKTTKHGLDGGGFNLDGGVTNSVLQYNLSYNNHGAGIGLFQFKTAPKWKNNTVRFNISINDGTLRGHCGIHIWSANNRMSDAKIYHNTIINEEGYGVVYQVGKEKIPGFVFSNNIFSVAGENGTIIFGNMEGSTYNNNLYWSILHEKPYVGFDLKALVADPKLKMPNFQEELLLDRSDPRTFRFCKLKLDSPCMKAAIPLTTTAISDFFGNQLPKKRRWDLGAHQVR